MPFRHFLRPPFVTSAKTAFVTTRGDDRVKVLYPWIEYANLHVHLSQLHQPEDINAPPRFSSSSSKRSSIETLQSSSSPDT